MYVGTVMYFVTQYITGHIMYAVDKPDAKATLLLRGLEFMNRIILSRDIGNVMVVLIGRTVLN